MFVMSYIVNAQIYYRMRLECTIRPVQQPCSLRRTAPANRYNELDLESGLHGVSRALMNCFLR